MFYVDIVLRKILNIFYFFVHNINIRLIGGVFLWKITITEITTTTIIIKIITIKTTIITEIIITTTTIDSYIFLLGSSIYISASFCFT